LSYEYRVFQDCILSRERLAWKFIKYEWIEVDAYASWSSLIKYLKKGLGNLGQEYAINFV